MNGNVTISLGFTKTIVVMKDNGKLLTKMLLIREKSVNGNVTICLGSAKTIIVAMEDNREKKV